MNSIRNLNELDVLDLLNEYTSELRKLQFKADRVKERIEDLENMYSGLKGSARSYPAPKAEAPPEKPAVQQTEQPEDSKDRKRKPYPLSEWDKSIFEILKEENQVLISAEILDKLAAKAKEKGIFKNDEDTKVKLNQHLVKLANRRGDLKKVKHKGRGFAYALPEWVDDRGHAKKEYKR